MFCVSFINSSAEGYFKVKTLSGRRTIEGKGSSVFSPCQPIACLAYIKMNLKAGFWHLFFHF
ncbi:hypothetical protein COV89_01670 [Candidatus Shapirobacteria bacterium CG11_big_fil_rev_8_21_14_0_20_40_12]|uniref:Uncharacterized protein n=2 Tax=Candidatus Shapironibacteriota TaxID=1752721 RepID=A0A2M8GG68_9BACT|nr:MAG: hypothetical protein COV89_01670 [Candidatus Shapirobacteria bacterium CG11_big_fil_rev_8_21_14_0_20_40_12]PJC76367.1 MAG: hypothetical protein CO010_02780 [Candidatus Shapirobacteria bacterium CG_4_8_14_3_um_filter_39_11]